MTAPSQVSTEDRGLVMRLFHVFGSHRMWSVVGSISIRAVGFLTSYVLARIGGAAAVGQYSSVVNTAGTVSTPVLAILPNTSTLHASREPAHARVLVSIYLRIALLFALGSCAAFIVMYLVLGATVPSDGTALGFAIAGGFASVIGQIAQGTLQGIWFGAGRFKLPVIWSTAIAAVVAVVGLSIAAAVGLVGFFGVLVVSALTVPAPLLLLRSHLEDASSTRAPELARNAWKLVRSTLSVGGSSIAMSLSSWTTLVLLVNIYHAKEGVGLVAIGGQWTTILVLAVTSWSGVTIKLLSDAQLKANRTALRATVRSLLVKHLLVTGLGCAAVALLASVIAPMYRDTSGSLAWILRINTLTALVLACNNVLERLLYSLDARTAWARAALAGGFVQLAFAALFVHRSVEMAPLATLAGAVTTLAVAARASRVLMAEA